MSESRQIKINQLKEISTFSHIYHDKLITQKKKIIIYGRNKFSLQNLNVAEVRCWLAAILSFHEMGKTKSFD